MVFGGLLGAEGRSHSLSSGGKDWVHGGCFGLAESSSSMWKEACLTIRTEYRSDGLPGEITEMLDFTEHLLCLRPYAGPFTYRPQHPN